MIKSFLVLCLLVFSSFSFAADEQKLAILGQNDIYTYIYDENTVKYNQTSDKFTAKTLMVFNKSTKIVFVVSEDEFNCKTYERNQIRQLHLDKSGQRIPDSSIIINIQDKEENRNFCDLNEIKRNKKFK